MLQVSVVIIAKNESANIVDCIESAKQLSHDIIVIDTGSCDDTVDLADHCGARVNSIVWKGYGNARNMGAKLAQTDWILALDADERVTSGLTMAIAKIQPERSNAIYGFRRSNFFGPEKVRHGPLGHDRVFRLYNRHSAAWSNVPVHETLIGKKISRTTLKAKILHYGNKNPAHYLKKKLEYAMLWAIKHHHKGKRAGLFAQFASTVVSFIKAYIFQLGFLDRKNGLLISKINAYYTWYKYDQLNKLIKDKNKERDIVLNESSLSFFKKM